MNLSVSYGTYKIHLDYKNESKLVYRACATPEKVIDTPQYRTQIQICPVDSDVPIAEVPIEPTSNIELKPIVKEDEKEEETPPTRPETNDTLPKRLMVGYWHNFENGSGFVKLRDVSRDWNLIHVSFAEPKDPSMNMGFETYTAGPNGYASAQAFKDDIALVQKRGQKVIISIGGEKGHINLSDEGKLNNFISTMNKIIDEYGFDGFDIDFEGQSLYLEANDYGHNFELGADPEMKNMPKTPVLANLIKAIRAIHKHTTAKGKKFILTMAPETFFVQIGHANYGSIGNGDNRAGAYLPVIDSVRDILTVLQVQNYNSGPVMGLDETYHNMGNADFHIICMQMLLEGFNIAHSKDSKLKFKPLRPDQVALGVPSTGSAGNGYTSNEEIHKALNCLEKGIGYTVKLANPNGYPGIRGIMSWSINWDVFTNSAFSGPNRKFLDSL